MPPSSVELSAKDTMVLIGSILFMVIVGWVAFCGWVVPGSYGGSNGGTKDSGSDAGEAAHD